MLAAWGNAVLFVLQLGTNYLSSGKIPRVSRDNETLITPAGYAFSIWGLIYTLLAVLVVSDAFNRDYTLFAVAANPTLLRGLFAATCVANTTWLVVFTRGWVHLATAVILVLWALLLGLYVSVSKTRSTFGFSYARYFSSDLGLTIYFAWVTAASMVSLAVSLQKLQRGILSLSIYVSMLAVLCVAGVAMVVFHFDWAFGVTVVWSLGAIAAKSFQPWEDPAVQRVHDTVRSCSALSAGVILALIPIAVIARASR